VGYGLQPEVAPQVEVVPQSKVDPQIEVTLQLEVKDVIKRIGANREKMMRSS
jgi:hypothetical protein